MSDPLINDDLAAFITSGVSITLASRSPNNIPSIARAKGCALLRSNPCRLRVFVSASQAKQLVADIQATHAISVTFSVPETYRTVQFKGFDAEVCVLKPEEHALIDEYIRVFAARIESLGFSLTYTQAFFASPSDVVALEFSPTDAFQQTPGPNAGARL